MLNPSPLRYPGGKFKTIKYIKELIKRNDCITYIEPFAGGCAVALKLLIDGDVKKVILNDFDRSIYAVWFSILHHTDELIRRILETEISIDVWKDQKKIQECKLTADIVDLGFSTLFLNRTNRSGIIKAGVIGGKKQDGHYKLGCRFPKQKIVEKIRLISSFRNKIELHNLDAVDFIVNVLCKSKKSLTFFDPPYYQKGSGLYTNFYKHADHVELAKKIHLFMKNRKWIITYDFCPEIKNIYNQYDHKIFKLNYSISENNKNGLEYMFFSTKLVCAEMDDYLEVIS